MAELLLRRLAGTSVSTLGGMHVTCVARHLGGAAALLDRPEEALTRLQLAELLLEHYPEEKTEALEHLDFAINEFREMKMQPSLERALRHKEILKA